MSRPSSRSVTATRIVCGLLGLVIGLSLLAPRYTAAQIRFGSPFAVSEQLTDTTTGELSRDRSVRLSGKLNVIFAASTDFVTGKWKYYPLDADAGILLVASPKIQCPEGLTAKVVSATAMRQEIEINMGLSTGTGKGFQINCEVEIAAKRDVEPGDYTVVVSFPGVSDTASIVKATRPTSPPTCTFNVKVWASEAARTEAKLAEQRRLKEEEDERQASWERSRIANMAADAERRKKMDEAIARERWQRQQATFTIGVLSLVIPVSFAAYARRRWWRTVRPKVHVPAGAEEAVAQPGLLETRLGEASWNAALKSSVSVAQQELAKSSERIATQAADALAAVAKSSEALAGVSRVAAIAAVRTGEMQSCLTTINDTTIYTLLFPEVATSARLLRRYPGLTDGWLAHADAARQELLPESSPTGLLCLLFFLSPDLQGGRFAVAYETADGRLATTELVEGDTGSDERPLLRVGEWGFHLAAPSPERAGRE